LLYHWREYAQAWWSTIANRRYKTQWGI
jgi:exonuclease RecJ (EC 3.1.-.-)